MICPVIVTTEENWIVAKDANSGVASQGKSMDEALSNLKEALELFYEDNEKEIIDNASNKSVYLTTLEVFA